jgi:hypothetical protein
MECIKKDLEQIKQIKKNYQDRINKRPEVVDLKKSYKMKKLPKSKPLY